MKKTIVILALMAMANSGFAQTDSAQGQFGSDNSDGTQSQTGTSQNQSNMSQSDMQGGQSQWASNSGSGNRMTDPFFSFNNVGDPKEIHKLGTDPEFRFLMNLSSSQQVYRAMKKHADNSNLNSILMNIGFANGVQDLQASNITPATIPSGTTGNMGAGNMQTGYYRLVGDRGFKAWKVTSDNGGYVFFMQACGNEFYPNSGKAGGTACINAPINVTAQPVSITANGQQTQVLEKTFVYYHIKRHHRRHMYTNPEIADARPSRPLLVSTKIGENLVPETYNVTLNSQTQNQMVCPDSTVNISANINVEKTSSYTGNYPNASANSYKLVTRREYRRAERKLRKAERKEDKVARFTKTPVDFMTDAPKSNS